MCGECPFNQSAPRGVWRADHYVGLALGHRAEGFRFRCHKDRVRPDAEQRTCGGWARARRNEANGVYDDPDVLGDAGAVLHANLRALNAIAAGGRCSGSGRPGRADDGLSARCGVCDRRVPTEDGLVAAHLPPEHPDA